MSLSLQNRFNGNDDEKYSLYLLAEKRVRPILVNLYDAIIGSNENANLLVTENPSEPSIHHFSGNTLACDGMSEVWNWLEQISLYAKSEEIFEKQFLGPFRLACNAVIDYRKCICKTKELKCWVFSMSESYYDASSDQYKKTLSVVVPEIGSVMSVRVPENVASDIGYGIAKFENCQPVPVVNRIHQTNTKNSYKVTEDVNLTNFDFLFLSFDDIEKISESMELENFCEVQSSQSHIKAHLGIPFITQAFVTYANGQNITLKDIRQNKTIKMSATDHISKNCKTDPSQCGGKYVRIFAVQWYSPRSSPEDVVFEKPEIFSIEIENKVLKLFQEDIVGWIRNRRNVALKEVKSRIQGAPDETKLDSWLNLQIALGVFQSTAPSQTIELRRWSSNDPICKIYLRITEELRALRNSLKLNAVRITEAQLIDRKKVDEESLKHLLMKKKILNDIILSIILERDAKGKFVLSANSPNPYPYPYEEIRKKLYFLRYVGLINNPDQNWQLTKMGHKVMSSIMIAPIRKKFSSSVEPISLAQAERDGISPSMLRRFLKDGELSGYTKMKSGGEETDLFWVQSGLPMAGTYEAEYNALVNSVFHVLLSVSYPLTTAAIIEKISPPGSSVGWFVTDKLLGELVDRGRINRSGESWEYPVSLRVKDMFFKYPDAAFSEDEILSKINSGLNTRQGVTESLSSLERNKIIIKLGDGWTKNENVVSKKAAAEARCLRSLIMSVLSGNRFEDEQFVIQRVEGTLVKNGLFGNGTERRNAIHTELNNLTVEGKVSRSEGMIKKLV